ncbi:MAG: galactokinase [Flavobacteriaceae bacterium]|nr:galactokinase [Flavobacteriaceae bacterium]
MNSNQIVNKFKELFKNEPLLVRSPGRINLIGEHTDYNDGFVFPAAIDKEIHFAVAKNKVNLFRFYAIDLHENFEMNVEDLSKSDTSWANYLLGVAAQYKKAGYKLEGVDCVFGGDIPLGAGLSSSAAIENGFAFALKEILKASVSKIQMIKMAQKAEHEYAGVMCGIMDQFASMTGKKDHAIKLDCRSLDYEYANINLKDYGILLCNTNVKHELASSEYNTRRKECETGVQILQKYDNSIIALRDVSLSLLQEHREEFDPIVYKRCEFVVKENLRVEEAFSALAKDDIKALGALMYQSHEGLRDDYDVSCKELDLLFDLAKKSDDVIGSRMMGGGFGGCTINIVKKEKVKSFSEGIKKEYSKITGLEPEIYSVKITDGTGFI